MKRVLKISITVLMLIMIAASTFIPVGAAEDKLSFNDTSASVGDTVTYTLKLGKCTEEVMGFQMYLFYDPTYLEVVPGTFSCPNVPTALFNENPKTLSTLDPDEDPAEPGTMRNIPLVFSDAVNPISFSVTKELLTVQFKVIAAGESDIAYFITELYGDDMSYLKSFELTNDIAVNDKTVVTDDAPKLADSEDIKNNYQGAFINYSDGKDDQKTTEEYHQPVTGEVPATEVTQDSTTSSSAVKKEDGGGFPFHIVLIIVVAVAFIAVIGGAIITIIRKK